MNEGDVLAVVLGALIGVAVVATVIAFRHSNHDDR